MNRELVETAFMEAGLGPDYVSSVVDKLIMRGDDIDLAKLRQKEIEELNLKITRLENEIRFSNDARLLEYGVIGRFIRRWVGDPTSRESLVTILFVIAASMMLLLLVK